MPKKHKGTTYLEARLSELKEQEKEQVAALRQSLSGLAESLSPSGLLKSSLKEVVTSPGLRENLVDTAIGIGAGMVGKKLFVGRSNNIFRKLGGTALEFFLANIVRKQVPGLRRQRAEQPDPAQ